MASSSSSSVAPALGPIVSEKLTRENYLLWKAQVLPAIRGAQLMQYLNGKTPAPPATTPWLPMIRRRRQFQILTTKETAAAAWKAIQDMFASKSRAKVTNLRFALTNTKKGTMTMAQYFSKMKGFADELASTGKVLEDEEIVSYILNGLDSEYTPLVSSVMSRTDPISVNELYAQALSFESRQDMLYGAEPQQFSSSVDSAMRGRGRGRGNNRGFAAAVALQDAANPVEEDNVVACPGHSKKDIRSHAVKSATSQIIQLFSVGTDMIRIIKVKRRLQELRLHLMELTLIGTQIPEQRTILQES
ncbi:hypothetical protein U9M48_008217 [Paspalum notatum var. saurae]|uniref:Retrotransposon Copia-like N-terminal domain-containing protein n=1 Tax=Paspalum notatum var. saurae TaxID=547442 RepID=A0AAQ3WCU5_PASNO